jgi:hypothetical protein
MTRSTRQHSTRSTQQQGSDEVTRNESTQPASAEIVDLLALPLPGTFTLSDALMIQNSCSEMFVILQCNEVTLASEAEVVEVAIQAETKLSPVLLRQRHLSQK